MSIFSLTIRNESFYNNGRIILNSLPHIESPIRNAFNTQVNIKTVTRKPKGKPTYTGISATDLNIVLRNQISTIPNLHGETHVKNGIFFPVSKEGFDFSLYDENYNYSRLYNYYMGLKGIFDGDKKIIEELSKKERNNLSKSNWRKQIQQTTAQVGGLNIDYIVPKMSLTVAGEFQFGNWALAYRDIIRLLNANINPGIDFYIYVTATGKLKDMLSDNTVNFDDINRIFQENSSLIQIPTWIIGLDI